MSQSGHDLTKSQLFLDDTWIEDQAMLTRVWHAAEIYPEPVLRPETPWEGTTLSMYGTVLRMGDVWRMYYGTSNPHEEPLVCVAESADGLHWTRPVLDIHEYRGSTANNIVRRNVVCPSVYWDPEDDVPFRSMVYRRTGGEADGLYGVVSDDGYHWTELDERLIPKPPTGDVHYLWSSRVDGKYIVTHKTRNLALERAMRTVAITESSDFRSFEPSQLILKSDLNDPADVQYHGMVGFEYGDMYLGLAERWFGSPSHIELLLVWSHDRVNWHLPPTRVPFIGPTYYWNQGWSTCSTQGPIQVGNQLRFYFGGRSGCHIHVKAGPRKVGVVGFAQITVDRFASISAGYMDGQLITKPMRWPGGDLILNASTTRFPDEDPRLKGGEMSIEVWDGDGQPIEGYCGDRRAPFTENTPSRGDVDAATIRWPDDKSMKELAGREIRLVFYMRDSHLYSFRSSG